MRAQGGRGKHNKNSLCLAQSIYGVTTASLEATEFQATTKLGEEAPRLAAKTKKWATRYNEKW